MQASISRWTDDGERAFVASDGTVFPLGIPLEVKATFLDGTVGVKNAVRNSAGRISYLHYVGAGAGVVEFSRELSICRTVRRRHPKTVLRCPRGLRSADRQLACRGHRWPLPVHFRTFSETTARFQRTLDDDSLGGFQASVALRVGFGGPRFVVPPPRSAPAPVTPPTEPAPDRRPQGVIVEAAPVFLLPDATRVPLRTLPAGTNVWILERKGDWIRVEFNDSQFGRRTGYSGAKVLKTDRRRRGYFFAGFTRPLRRP